MKSAIKFLLLPIAFILFISNCAIAQLLVTTGMTPQQYVQQLLGPGITVSNVTFTGNGSLQIGAVSNGNTTNIGLDSGIIMSTGSVLDAPGPNNNTGISTAFTPTTTDPDLVTISGGTINDAAVLQFDFVPQGDTLKFQYVFGSDEYPEYVNSYNDAFGFFLSGPGIVGPYTNSAVNIALIPNTTTPVTINNVNDGYFNCPGPTSGCANCAYYVNNCGGTTIQYDGFTTVLTAIYPVQCGQTYHIKLAVGDALDQALDSFVLLKAGSFNSGHVTLSSNININSNDSVLYEGCGSALLDLIRGEVQDSTTVYFYTSGTATDSVDYTNVPDSMVFIPGDDSLQLNISAYQDGLNEGMESVIIGVVQIQCGVLDTQEVKFYIEDSIVVSTLLPNDTICLGESTTLQPTITPSFVIDSILWSTGDTTSSITVSPTADTTYYYTLSGPCVAPFTDSVEVHVNTAPPVPILITGDDSICFGDSSVLTVSGGVSYNWSDSLLGNSNPVSVFPLSTTNYTVIALDSNGCHDTANYTVNVLPLPTLNILGDSGICQGDTTTLSANGANSYTWIPGGNTDSITVSPSSNTTYMVVGTDAFGCIDTETVTVSVSLPPTISISGDTVICLGDFSTLTASGAFTYQWSTGANTASTQVSPTSQTTYYVIGTNVAGCAAEDSIYIHVNPLPNITISGDTALCPGSTFTELTANGGNSYLWQPGGQTTDSISVPIGNYSVTGTDTNGCTNTDNVIVAPYPVPNVDFSFTPDSACGIACVQFTNNSSVSSGSIADYYWIFGDGNNSSDENPKHCYGSNNGNLTTYFPQLIATSNAGCKDSLTSATPVVVLPLPTASFSVSPTPPIKPTVTAIFTSTSTGANSYSWESNDGQSGTDSAVKFQYAAQGNYLVCLTVTNVYGCEDSACQTIEVLSDLFIPNVITPNGDGINDVLYIKGLPFEGNNAITIYDRWGRKVYHSENYKNDWGGTTQKGKNLSDGTYYYILLLGDGKTKTGYVTILD